MGTKVILYVTILIATVSLYFNTTANVEYINIRDTLNIETVIFETIVKYDTVTNVITKNDSFYFERILRDTLWLTDTVRTVDFYLDNSWCNITGRTYHRTIGNSTFDILASRKPIELTLESKWVNSQFVNELYENGIKIPFKSKVEYEEYDNYINELIPKWYKRPYTVIPATFVGTLVIAWIVKESLK